MYYYKSISFMISFPFQIFGLFTFLYCLFQMDIRIIQYCLLIVFLIDKCVF